MLKFSGLLFLCFTITNLALSQPYITPVVNDQLFPVHAVLVKGYVGGKLDASYQNRILAQDVDRLVAPFRNRPRPVAGRVSFGENGSRLRYLPTVIALNQN